MEWFRVMLAGEVRVHVDVCASDAKDAEERTKGLSLVPSGRGLALSGPAAVLGAVQRQEFERAEMDPLAAVTVSLPPPDEDPGDGGWEV